MDEQSELQRGLGRVEGKLDALLASLAAQDQKDAEFETRLRKVEGRLLYFSGASVAIGVFLAKVDFTKLIAVAHAAGTLG